MDDSRFPIGGVDAGVDAVAFWPSMLARGEGPGPQGAGQTGVGGIL